MPHFIAKVKPQFSLGLINQAIDIDTNGYSELKCYHFLGGILKNLDRLLLDSNP